MGLPAPYAPPWKRLGEDLVATLAWLGLKARELWRRNGEGSLPIPAFWPRRWPQGFWPLILALLLLLGGVAAGSLRPPAAGTSAAVDRPAAAGAGSASKQEPSIGSEQSLAGVSSQADGPSPAPGSSSGPTETTGPAPFPGGPEALEGATPSAPEGDPAGAPVDGPQGPQAGDQPAEKLPEPETPEVGGEDTLWQEEDPKGWIIAHTSEPASSALSLQINEPFLALPSAERQRWAQRWQERAADLGYSHLEIRDDRGRLVGRSALVGRGMILLQPAAEGGPSR